MRASEVNGRMGETRSALRTAYLLHAPDSFVRTPLPGLKNGSAIVHASPALGAKFLMYTVELQAGGVLPAASDHTGPEQVQRFVWVLSGEILGQIQGKRPVLGPGHYIFGGNALSALSAATIIVFEKRYEPLPRVLAPNAFVGHEEVAIAVPLASDPGVLVRSLLPAEIEAGFDFAVNTMTYAPGAALSQVEVHVMEHGLIMLEGAGTYRLDGDFHDVEPGDAIWMGSYCPQWFRADPSAPAKYLIYKDWNRRPSL